VHSESGNARAVSNLDLEDIRHTILQYPLERVYNFDEAGLFYCLAPDKSIAACQILGAKKDKTWMTIGLMVNMTGTDRDMVFIVHAKKPHCFEKKSAAEHGFYYRSNKTPWMTALFFQDVVKQLNGRVKHKVLLIVDSLSCHSLGNLRFENVEVLFLPPSEL
jgi:hypothetical protein